VYSATTGKSLLQAKQKCHETEILCNAISDVRACLSYLVVRHLV